MARTNRKELFKFMIDRVKDVANLSFIDEPRAFTKWFLTLILRFGTRRSSENQRWRW